MKGMVISMNEYAKQANDFLTKANAICKIEFGGVSRNESWKEKEKRNWYDVTITTPNGTMNFVQSSVPLPVQMLLVSLSEFVTTDILS